MSRQIIEELLKEAGYKKGEDFIVWVNPKQGNDVDLKVKLHGKYILVAEILNWSVKSILSQKRKRTSFVICFHTIVKEF